MWKITNITKKKKSLGIDKDGVIIKPWFSTCTNYNNLLVLEIPLMLTIPFQTHLPSKEKGVENTNTFTFQSKFNQHWSKGSTFPSHIQKSLRVSINHTYEHMNIIDMPFCKYTYFNFVSPNYDFSNGTISLPIEINKFHIPLVMMSRDVFMWRPRGGTSLSHIFMICLTSLLSSTSMVGVSAWCFTPMKSI